MGSPQKPSLVVIGAGVVGRAFAERLRGLRPDRRLRLTARSTQSVDRLRVGGFAALPFDLIEADAAETDTIVAGADCVVLSAAAGRGGDYQAVYEHGSSKLAAACERNGAHLVYTSSTGVYAESAGGWVDEQSPLAESDDRTRALVAAERNVREINGTVLRLSGILAPERGPHRRLEALAGTTRDDGEAWVNLVPLPTILDALCVVVDRDWRGVVNVSGAMPLRRQVFYDALLARAALEPIDWQPPPHRAERGRRVRVDRLRSELGVDPLEIDAAWLMP